MTARHVALAVVLAAATPAAADPTECRVPEGTFTVSFPAVPVAKDERIVGFELAVKGASVVGVERMPKGWSIKADSDDPTREKVSGTTQRANDELGTAAELPAIAMSRNAGSSPVQPFELDGIVYTSADSKTYVRHRFACGDLLHGKP